MKERIRRIVSKEYENTLGIVAYKNNQKVYEEYFKGANHNEAVHAFSVTKSVVSILIGIAIDKGYMKGVDQKVLDFFPDYKLKRNQEQLKELTIEHFLTMTVPYKYKYEPYTKVFKSQNWGETVLELIGGRKQVGEVYHYSTVGIQVLSNIMAKATGMSLKEFAQKYLFDKLGIYDVPDAPIHDKKSQEEFYRARNVRGWAKDPSGYYTTGWGLALTTEEFARIGLLCLNNGVYNGERIVSEGYIKKMSTEKEKGYGYMWWIYHKDEKVKILRKEYETGKYDCYCANGVGGSLIAVIPEVDIVICMTCSMVYNPKVRMELINQYLLPYIDKIEISQ